MLLVEQITELVHILDIAIARGLIQRSSVDLAVPDVTDNLRGDSFEGCCAGQQRYFAGPVLDLNPYQIEELIVLV